MQFSSASVVLILIHSHWAFRLLWGLLWVALVPFTLIDKSFFVFSPESIPILHRVYDVHDSINSQSISRLEVLVVSIELFSCQHWPSSDSVLVWDWLHTAVKTSFFYSSSDHFFISLLPGERCFFRIEDCHCLYWKIKVFILIE